MHLAVEKFYALIEGPVPGCPGVEPEVLNQKVTYLGELKVWSGKVEASDPFVALGESSKYLVPNGFHKVFVSSADVSEEQDGSHLRETYLSLVFSEEKVKRIEFALPVGEAPPAVEVTDQGIAFCGVPVDTGTVAWVDAQAREFMPVYAKESETTWYEDVFDGDSDDSWFSLMDSTEHYVEGSANIILPEAVAGENVVLSHSGWGDGYYPVIAAYDSENMLVALHIDLMVAYDCVVEMLFEDE